ncbi:hypothetical protein GUITHDRAFT_121416 [Guillardia theta CCMP2712]|uniref:Uncharacterized protein n=1 Tax=Guillardia theta (strain CCMP2712) TaxID=905079 RepID=L1I8K7_GUITC|nr:hypothetical protein GUITHDRAFT_121416 [Guillardia theta CCMP2712]EKX32412.1 hypothetical protein GUITHDRAFT_121416 [Guillardia theta CCMP2712]|eukprot:XP_005819392.1 hypothetical protein GUITHDRAFT_121416 [Guillardia theta CCMP2712]
MNYIPTEIGTEGGGEEQGGISGWKGGVEVGEGDDLPAPSPSAPELVLNDQTFLDLMESVQRNTRGLQDCLTYSEETRRQLKKVTSRLHELVDKVESMHREQVGWLKGCKRVCRECCEDYLEKLGERASLVHRDIEDGRKVTRRVLKGRSGHEGGVTEALEEAQMNILDLIEGLVDLRKGRGSIVSHAVATGVGAGVGAGLTAGASYGLSRLARGLGRREGDDGSEIDVEESTKDLLLQLLNSVEEMKEDIKRIADDKHTAQAAAPTASDTGAV